LVVDLRGGWADKASLRRWNDDTRTVLFSATKAVAALAVAMCVDRGYVRYEQRVVEFWPEFGKHGKEETTVDWVMSHRAGLAVIDEPISLEGGFLVFKILKFYIALSSPSHYFLLTASTFRRPRPHTHLPHHRGPDP